MFIDENNDEIQKIDDIMNELIEMDQEIKTTNEKIDNK